MKIEYAVQIIWSAEDGAYIAMPMELPGCMADGKTPEEALANLKVIIAEWIDVATEEGRDIPKAMSIQEMAKQNGQALVVQQKKIQQYIQQEVEKAVSQVMEKLFPPASGAASWPEFHSRAFFNQPPELVEAGPHRR